LREKFEGYFADMCSAGVDGGPSGWSSVCKPRREDPISASGNFNRVFFSSFLFLSAGLLFLHEILHWVLTQKKIKIWAEKQNLGTPPCPLGVDFLGCFVKIKKMLRIA
jgi:hypothetical protein